MANLTGITPDYVLVTSFKGLKRMVAGTAWHPREGLVAHARPRLRLPAGDAYVHAARRRSPSPGSGTHCPLGDFQRSFDQGQLLKGGLSTIKSKVSTPGFYEHALGLLAQWTDTNMSPVEMYRLGRDVLEVNPTKVQTCVLQGGTRHGGRGEHRRPRPVAAAQSLAVTSCTTPPSTTAATPTDPPRRREKPTTRRRPTDWRLAPSLSDP